MANFLSRCGKLVGSALLAGTMAFSTPALASDFKVLPDYRLGGEVSYKLAGYDRVIGHTHIEGEIGLMSFKNAKLSLGARLINYFRGIDKTTDVQPDVINYDVWPRVSFSNDYGEFSISYFHQCMHNIDEMDHKLVNDSRSHNIVLFTYEGERDVLEGLEAKLAAGPMVFVVNSGYNTYFLADTKLNLLKLSENIDLYVRAMVNPILSEKSNAYYFLLNMENEIGVEISGKSKQAQVFFKHEMMEDYLTFDSGSENLFYMGIRFR